MKSGIFFKNPLIFIKSPFQLIVHPKATVNVISLDQALLDEPKATTSGKYAWFERTYMDSFVLANRKDGIAVVTSA